MSSARPRGRTGAPACSSTPKTTGLVERHGFIGFVRHRLQDDHRRREPGRGAWMVRQRDRRFDPAPRPDRLDREHGQLSWTAFAVRCRLAVAQGGRHALPRSEARRVAAGRGPPESRHRSGRGSRIAPGRGARSLRGLGLTGHTHGCDRGAQAWSALPAGAGHGCPRRGRSAGGESRGAPCGGTRRAHARPHGRSRERGAGAPSRALPGQPSPTRPRGAAGGDRRRRHRHRIECPGRGHGGARSRVRRTSSWRRPWLQRSGWPDWPT